MKKKSVKNSISKKTAWSLILAVKEAYHQISNNQNKVSFAIQIRGTKYSFTYDILNRQVLRKNFELNKCCSDYLDLYLPIILNDSESPYIIAHLAQTLDGFIATNSGESKYISSEDNLEHIHMLRGISDIILVGSHTVSLDNPRLTTRLVKGPSPMRIILDKSNSLNKKFHVFKNKDNNGYKIISDNIKCNADNIFQLPLVKDYFDLRDVTNLLTKLNKKIVFIEGGGKTVSSFLNNNLLNKLHLCVSPIIIGKGRSSFISEKKIRMNDINDYKINHYKMGNDILLDLDLS